MSGGAMPDLPTAHAICDVPTQGLG